MKKAERRVGSIVYLSKDGKVVGKLCQNLSLDSGASSLHIGLFLAGVRFRFKVCTPDFQLNDKVFCTREQSLYCFCTKTDLFFQVLGPIKLCGSCRLLSCASLHFLTHSATLFERGAPRRSTKIINGLSTF